MQKPCLLVATRRVEFVDKKKFATAGVAQEVIPFYELTCFSDPDFANLLDLYSAAEFFKWPAASLWN